MIRTFTIYLISKVFFGPIAEMLLTRLARSYYYAGGFCVDHVGKRMQNMRMDKLSEQEIEEIWGGDCPEAFASNPELVNRVKKYQEQVEIANQSARRFDNE